MIPKPFAEPVTRNDIDHLVANSVREGRTIEYKQELPDWTDDSKKEFLADVSSFANAGGGDLLYGIREARDTAGKPTGIPEEATGVESLNPDQLLHKLQNLIAASIEPRVPVRIEFVGSYPAGSVIVIRVPQTWNGPHMVTYRRRPCFYSRSGAGKMPLDVTEIRTAFLASDSLTEKIRRFRDDRIAKIVAGELPAELEPIGCAVLHVIPVSAFREGRIFDTDVPYNMQPRLAPFKGASGYEPRMNLDGYFIRTPARPSNKTRASTQFFRSGAIEVIYARIIQEDYSTKNAAYRDIQIIHYNDIEGEIPAATERMTNLLLGLGANPPFLFFATLIGVRGAHIRLRSPFTEYSDHCFDRDIIAIPEVLVEAIPFDREVLRPMFDTIWQSCGFASDPLFDSMVLGKSQG